ncbi:MAG: cbb3-type cytochrome c oxidase subunit I [Planctomycetes bacterium]|nr:cbb3-type cytochrome c oxidase subunit I [Planctomycetota bacterium]
MNDAAKIAATPAARGASASPGAELWLFSVDHERLARSWAATAGLALVAGLVLALALSVAPLAEDSSAVWSGALYTMHGLALVFLVVLPAIPGVIGNALLPRLVGAEAMAWPRANALGFQIHLFGVACFLAAFVVAPADAGWTFAVPYSITTGANPSWTLLGMVAVACGAACSAANVLATLAASRARAAGGWSLPVLAWALGSAAVLQALAAPVLVAVSALLFAERAGGSEVLGAATAAADARFAQAFAAFAHPASCAAVLAALGLVDHLLAPDERRGEPASATSVHALVALAVAAVASCGAHAVGGAGSPTSSVAHGALALAAGVPFAVLVAGWFARPAGAADAARCLAAAAGALLVFGALTALLLVLPAGGALLAGTTIATVPLHFAGTGVVAAALAGMHALAPRWLGAPARGGRGRAAAVLLVVGALCAFGPAIVAGLAGAPRRASEPRVGLAPWIAAVGGLTLAGALLLAAWNVVAAWLEGRTREAA